ncbi:hypothetical protein ACFWOX_21920 [Streptomyces sp. NPDC058467]|uniref:hypothetical protein n=1 Tax=Streptomyces sp. NPDC058467 TaxID=3346513 RepID=UPI0036524EAB
MPPENSRLLYEELRRRWGSVAPVEILPSVTAWLVLDHQAALEVIWNERLFSSDARAGTRTKRGVWYFAAVFPPRVRQALPAGASQFGQS